MAELRRSVIEEPSTFNDTLITYSLGPIDLVEVAPAWLVRRIHPTGRA